MLKAQRKSDHGRHEEAEHGPDVHEAQAMPASRSSTTLGAGYHAGPAVTLTPRVQQKLQMGRVDDPYEREADRVADHVTAGEPVPAVSHLQLGSLTGQRSEDEGEDEAAQAKCSASESEAAAQRKSEATDAAQAKCSACESEQKVQASPAPEVAQAACDACDPVQKQETTRTLKADARATPPRATEDEAAPAAPQADAGGEFEEGDPRTEGAADGEEQGKEPEEDPVKVEGASEEDANAPSCDDGTAPAPKAPDDENEGAADAEKPQRLNPAADLDCDGGGGGKDASGGDDAGGEAPEAAGGDAKKSCKSGPSEAGGEEDVGDDPDAAKPGNGERPPAPDQSVPGCGEGQAEASKEPDPGPEEDQGASGSSPAGPEAPKVSANCAAVQKRSLNEDVHDSDEQHERRAKPRGEQLEHAEQRIRRRGEGDPLPPAVKGRIESSVGVDLGGVRVHSDSNAQAASKALKAKAFTHRSHIFLGAGQSKHDVGLMAHETTHVLQQGAIERKPAESKAKSRPAEEKSAHKPEAAAEESEKTTAPAATGKAPGEHAPKSPATSAATPAAAGARLTAPSPAAGAPAAAHDKPATARSATAHAAAKESREQGPLDQAKKSDTPDQTVHPPVPPNLVRQAELHASAKLSEHKLEATVAKNSTPAPGKQVAPGTQPTGDAKAAGPAGGILAAPQAGARAASGAGASESVAAVSEPAAEKAKPDPASDPRFQGTIKRLHRAATREREHVGADEKVEQAKHSVKAPDDEPRSHAANENVAGMATGADSAPAPKEQSFEDLLNAKLEDIRPKNMEQTLEFKESGAAGKLKNEVGKQIKQQKNDTVGPLQKATVAPLDTAKYPNPKEKKLEPDPADPAQRSLHAEDVLPEPKSEEEVSVDTDKDEADRLMKENDLDEDQLKRANEPQFTAVIEAKEKLDENSAKVVPTYRQEEAKLLDKGAKEVARTSAHALGGMRGKRKDAKDKVLKAQDAARQKEEEERKTVVGNVNSKFNATQSAVKSRLDGLDSPVSVLFDIAEMGARQQFESRVDQLMTAYKKDRYSGVSGKLAWGWDKLTGMPKEVDEFYVEGTKVYIAAMKTAFRDIAKFVDAQLAAAKADIAKGKKEITDYLAGLKGKRKEYGDTAFTAIEGDLAALESSVEDKKQNLAGDLVQKYKASRAALDERIDELKAENAGLLGKLVAFIKKVVAILKKLKDLAVMLMRVGGAVLRGIVKDPGGFLGNLIDAVKSGFGMFVEHIGRHLKDALISFVTGSMKDVGVSGSSDGLPGGIGGILLQVLGLTPQNLKEKVAAKLGIREPSLIERAWEKVKTLLADGASALWEKLTGFIGNIRDKIETEIKEWIGLQIVKAGMMWIVSLFTPASALLRAIKMIYDVMSFYVNNLDRIIDLVNGVLKSVTAVVAGNIAGAAKMIESAAAKGLAFLLGFLASVLGLSGIGDKIRAIIQRVRAMVDRAIDAILNVMVKPFKWIARKAAPLVARGKAAVKRGKAAVQRARAAVARFLFPRRNFSGGGENHTLYFAGEGENSPLMVASTPRTLLKFVTELRQRPENKRGEGKGALDRTTKHFAEIRRLQKELRRRPTKVGHERINTEMAAIASILREILMRGDFATKANPLPLVWTKPPSADYKPLFLGPKLRNSEQTIQQPTLEAAKDAGMDARARIADRLRLKNDVEIEAWEKKRMPIKTYEPHERKATPDGEHTLGLTRPWKIFVGRELQLPTHKPPGSPGGGVINDVLKPYGYNPGAEYRDGDHVVEMQLGGDNVLENLWPLNADVNRASGTNIRKQEFALEGGVTISMGQLKELARRRKNPRAVWLKISKTG